MAVSRKIDPKRATQNPDAFYKGEQQGGAHGTPTKVPEKIQGGPMREKMRRDGL